MGKFFKTAFGPKAMDTVLKLFKKKQIPRALSQKVKEFRDVLKKRAN